MFLWTSSCRKYGVWTILSRFNTMRRSPPGHLCRIRGCLLTASALPSLARQICEEIPPSRFQTPPPDSLWCPRINSRPRLQRLRRGPTARPCHIKRCPPSVRCSNFPGSATVECFHALGCRARHVGQTRDCRCRRDQGSFLDRQLCSRSASVEVPQQRKTHLCLGKPSEKPASC